MTNMIEGNKRRYLKRLNNKRIKALEENSHLSEQEKKINFKKYFQHYLVNIQNGCGKKAHTRNKANKMKFGITVCFVILIGNL